MCIRDSRMTVVAFMRLRTGDAIGCKVAEETVPVFNRHRIEPVGRFCIVVPAAQRKAGNTLQCPVEKAPVVNMMRNHRFDITELHETNGGGDVVHMVLVTDAAVSYTHL